MTTEDWKGPRKARYFSKGKGKGEFVETETCGALWWVQGKPRIPILVNGKRVHVWLDQLEPLPEPVAMKDNGSAGYGYQDPPTVLQPGTPYPASSPWANFKFSPSERFIIEEMDQYRKFLRGNQKWFTLLRESDCEKFDGSG